MIKKIFRKLGLGKLAYILYYLPQEFSKKIFKRGIINSVIDDQNRIEMEKATYKILSIASVPDVSNNVYDVYFLTGEKFWYQTCFCMYSLIQASGENLRPVIYDDGTLQEGQVNEIKRIFFNVKIVSTAEIQKKLDECLPSSKFPYLRERRIDYLNIRKLIDPHIASSGWKMVLDSDMLFFRNPIMLVDWLKDPRCPCHMVDVENSYGYSIQLMEHLAKAKVAQRVNVGVCGLKSEDIDWEKLEYWCKKLIEKAGMHYYMEQALTAMLIAGKECTVLPPEEYVVMPGERESMKPKAAMYHYVAQSKPWYFRHGWRNIIS